MRSRPMWWMVCLALIVAALPHPARAQGTSASIQGSVIDDSGPLPGATIVAKDTQSGFQHDAVTGGGRHLLRSPVCALAPTRSP